MIRQNGVVLDDHSLDILECIDTRGGASTSDLRMDDSVELEDNDRIRGRLYKLQKAGIIEITDAEFSIGGKPPKIGRIVNQESVEDLLETRNRYTLEEDVEYLLSENKDQQQILKALFDAVEELGGNTREYLPDDF